MSNYIIRKLVLVEENWGFLTGAFLCETEATISLLLEISSNQIIDVKHKQYLCDVITGLELLLASVSSNLSKPNGAASRINI